MPERGLEPPRLVKGHWYLKPACIPFHHSGSNQYYIASVCNISRAYYILDLNIFTWLIYLMENGFINDIASSAQILPPAPEKVRAGKIFFIISYFAAIPVFVFFIILFSLALKYEASGQISRQEHSPQFQALPSDGTISSVEVENHDARILSLDEFFASYNSPLEGHAKTIIDEADKNKIDYRLLPAIAMQESTLCKKIIKNSFNCWGFGIYGGKVTKFDNYDHAIKVITSTLAKKYVQKGYVSPEEIVKKYTPSDTGRWPEVVNMIMTRLKASI